MNILNDLLQSFLTNSIVTQKFIEIEILFFRRLNIRKILHFVTN